LPVENGTVGVNVLTAATHAQDTMCLLHVVVSQMSRANDQTRGWYKTRNEMAQLKEI